MEQQGDRAVLTYRGDAVNSEDPNDRVGAQGYNNSVDYCSGSHLKESSFRSKDLCRRLFLSICWIWCPYSTSLSYCLSCLLRLFVFLFLLAFSVSLCLCFSSFPLPFPSNDPPEGISLDELDVPALDWQSAAVLDVCVVLL